MVAKTDHRLGHGVYDPLTMVALSGRRIRGQSLFALAGLTVAVFRLIDGRGEIRSRIAQRDAAFAVRHAAVSLALHPTIDLDRAVARAAHQDRALHQDRTGPVERDQVGRAVALAGHDDEAARLYRHIRD